jgi:hypothetical protein
VSILPFNAFSGATNSNVKNKIQEQGKERRNTILNYLEDTKKQPLDLSKSGSFTWNPNKKVVFKH